jgi:hypothetical protein
MSSKKSAARRRAQAGTFVGCLRQFLTPALFKQVHQACPRRRCRWGYQPLLFVLLCMTWCQGETQAERFEAARAFYVALHPKRRRPGSTLKGFERALARLPASLLRLTATAVRLHLRLRLGGLLETFGWKVFGCDGSQLLCPRTAELEERLGRAGGRPGALPSPPQLALSALVHLRSGLLWAWRLGKGVVNERDHLKALLGTLPKGALVVTDAGYQGYELACALAQAGVSFLIRVTSLSTLYNAQDLPVQAADWSDGLAYYWTGEAQRKGLKPLLVRLLRVRSPRRKHDVWLITNVLQGRRLSAARACLFYQMRWENEGFFRTYKRTLGKVKLGGRTVKAVHREAEGSLLAVQLLLAQGAQARLLYKAKQANGSARRLLEEVRQEIHEVLRGKRRGRKGYQRRLAEALRDDRQRTSSKVKRIWPGRKDHTPPKPPKVRELNAKQKALLAKLLQSP